MMPAIPRDRSIPSWHSNPNFSRFSREYRKNKRLQLFVGSGLSVGAGYPSWKCLLTEIRERAEREHHLEIKDVDEFQSHIEKKDFGLAGDILYNSFPRSDASPWRVILEEIFSSSRDSGRNGTAIKSLLSLRWDRILTTNYDTLLEEYSNEKSEIIHPETPDYQRCQASKDRFIFKLHGDVKDKNSKLIVTQQDYDKLYGAGGSPRPPFVQVLETLLTTHPLTLIVGYGHHDPYIRERFQALRRQNPTSRVFALIPMPDRDMVAEFESKHRDIAKDTGIRFIPYDRGRKGTHEELTELLQYLANPQVYDSRYRICAAIRRPTIVLLSTGGTISSAEKGEDAERTIRIGLKDISNRFSDKIADDTEELLKRFRSLYDRGSKFDFDLRWEFLESNNMLLSENADVEHWNNILVGLRDTMHKYVHGPSLIGSAHRIVDTDLSRLFERDRKQYEAHHPDRKFTFRQFAEDIKGRFLVGIVVLHGTDSMAFSAAALSFATEDLPCSVVITGSNLPPGNSLLERKSRFYWISDAWDNIVTSIYFLISIGHRYTEVLTCFGDTVHHGINLRKVHLGMLPFKGGVTRFQKSEPFGFRNVSSHQQYMFRLIDDIICNNYYPIQEYHHDEIVSDLNVLRHARIKPFSSNPPTMKFRRFFPCVAHLRASPCPAELQFKDWLSCGRDGEELRVVVLEGYDSGTYPSAARHKFTKTLAELEKNAIPIVLISQYGIMGSQKEYEAEVVAPVVRLFGIIAESAVPLLSFLVGSIDRNEWHTKLARKSSKNRLEARKFLVIKAVQDFLAHRQNIITAGLGPITSSTKMEVHIQHQRRSEFGSFASSASLTERQRQALARTVHVDRVPVGDDGNVAGYDGNAMWPPAEVNFPRSHFIKFIVELVSPFEAVGAGPDGFLALSDIGFHWGFHEFPAIQSRKDKAEIQKPYYARASDDRRKVENVCKRLVRKVEQVIKARGIADIQISEFSLSKEMVRESGGGVTGKNGRGVFSFEVTIYRSGDPIGEDERFAAKAVSQEEIAFFSQLNAGPDSETSDVDFFAQLDNEMHGLRRATWRYKTGPTEWFVIGLSKGLACALAFYLGFDHYAESFAAVPDARHLAALRQAVHCELKYGVPDTFRFGITYYGWRHTEESDKAVGLRPEEVETSG